jgi:hypothetical protein
VAPTTFVTTRNFCTQSLILLGEEPETSDHLMSSDTAGSFGPRLFFAGVLAIVFVGLFCRGFSCCFAGVFVKKRGSGFFFFISIFTGLVGIDLGVDITTTVRSADFVPGRGPAPSALDFRTASRSYSFLFSVA